MKYNLKIVTFILLAALFGANYASSDTDKLSAKKCYEAKDLNCLESLQPKISFNKKDKQPQNYDAPYYLALHFLEEKKDPEQAKEHLLIAIMFGRHEKSKQKLTELYNDQLVTLAPTECLAIDNLDCLYNLADNKNNKNAQYLLGQQLIEDNPESAIKYLQKASSQGHGTAPCVLANGAKDGILKTNQTYHEAVEYLVNECSILASLNPYKRLGKKYYKRYLSKQGHKAYAHSDSGSAYYRSGFVTPGLAAKAALDSCIAANKNQDKYPCRVINVDNKWVKKMPLLQFSASDKKGVDMLLTKSAVKYYNEKYKSITTAKVLVQSDSGIWYGNSSSSDSLDLITEKALTSCQTQNKKMKLDKKFSCRVINQNGEWK